MEPVTTIGSNRDADGGFRKKYGPKSTDSLTFSIARIMEPDVRHKQSGAPAVDYYYALESAFKKYVPQFRSNPGQHCVVSTDNNPRTAAVQLFHYRPQARPRPVIQSLPVQPLPVQPLPAQPTLPPQLSQPLTKTVATKSNTVRATPPSNTTTTTAKTFTCSHCGKVFFAHYNLTRHMPVHTGARPFICKVI